MSLVENLVNQISTHGLGGITKPFGFDMEDDTFAKLLEKQLNSPTETNSTNFIGNMGAPAGLIIEPLDSVNHAETVQDQMEIIGEKKLSRDEYINQPIEFKDLNIEDHFSKLLKLNLNNSNSDFMNFARKQATNNYGVFAKNLVLDTTEFVQDILGS